jgi:hypothetical protein
MPRAAILSLAFVMVALLAIIGYAGRHEIAQQSVATAASAGSAVQQPPPLTPEEEAFATALWPMHSEVVEPSAVRLTFAGMVYATDDHDARKLAATLQPVSETFRAALDKARNLDVPASMQAVHELYLQSLSLYVKASAEMLKVAQDGNDQHMVDAQVMSKLASEDLLKAGDVLWPGEHKPN